VFNFRIPLFSCDQSNHFSFWFSPGPQATQCQPRGPGTEDGFDLDSAILFCCFFGRNRRKPNLVPRAFLWGRGARRESLVWAAHVTIQNMDIFDSYSSRSGEIFLTEIYKSSKHINSPNTPQSILFICSEVCHIRISWNLWRHCRCCLRYTDISGDFQAQWVTKMQ
jgi:hypothetical protein